MLTSSSSSLFYASSHCSRMDLQENKTTNWIEKLSSFRDFLKHDGCWVKGGIDNVFEKKNY